ncbi:hypothetical protein SERLADRAFT_434846 [Serpula lacrymans var. lacrymans S7.9]|nr:uncharacterized protein SERLADRAFT_434846 [Serpula lacrymans var. lacrymans S7.9]EGO27072.1 hypothetical protein SERLADRAFT_434846 [Serpula lacrymans var. lacrymans S7.9]
MHVASEEQEDVIMDEWQRSQAYIWQLEERVRLLEEENQQLNNDLTKFRLLPFPYDSMDDDSVGPKYLNLTSQIKDLHTQNLVKALSEAMSKATLHSREVKIGSTLRSLRPPPSEHPQCDVHVANPDIITQPTPPVKARSYTSKQSLATSRCAPLSLSDIRQDVQSARENLTTIGISIHRAKAFLKDVREDAEVSSKADADVLEALTAEQEGHRSTKVKLQALRQTLRSAMEQD